MYGFMRDVEFDCEGTSEIIVPRSGPSFVVRRIEIADTPLMSHMAGDGSSAAYFMLSLDGEILSPLMTEAGMMLVLYSKTTTSFVQ